MRTHSLARLLIAAFGGFAVTIATIDIWADGSGLFEDFCWHLQGWLYQSDFAVLERELGFPKQAREADVALAIAGVLVIALSKRLGSLCAGVLLVCFPWMIANQIDIMISDTQLTVFRRWWWDLRLPRETEGIDNLQIRVVNPAEYFSWNTLEELYARGFFVDRVTHPPAIVEIVHGFRRHKVIMARREDEAEAIVARCSEALIVTNPSFVP